MIAGQSSRRVPRLFTAAAPLCAALLLCGCGESLRYSPDLRYPLRTDPIVDDPPKEQPWASEEPGHLEQSIEAIPAKGGKITDPKAVAADLREKLRVALNDAFGTPYQPRVGVAQNEDAEVVDSLKKLRIRDADDNAPFHTLATGSKAYRFHCLHCHGLTGDGRGPTGPWVVPHPRDYRPGKFKFISVPAEWYPNAVQTRLQVVAAQTVTSHATPDLASGLTQLLTLKQLQDVLNESKITSKGRPRREDLLRTLHQGIDGTSMPSFGLLSDEELNGLASYVMHLSIRGQVEMELLVELDAGNDYPDMADEVRTRMITVVQQWQKADGAPVIPAKDSYKELSSKQMAESIRRGYKLFSDPAGTASCIGCHQDYGRQVPFKYDAWGTLVRPANLTLGVYRGGRRPIDIFWRIRNGIDPSNMPLTGVQYDKDVWDVVNFVQAMPYPQMLPEDVRYKIYDRPPGAQAKEAERVER